MKVTFATYTQDYEKNQMPLGLAYLSAMAKKTFGNVQVRWVFGSNPERLAKDIAGHSPDVLGFSATSKEFSTLRLVADAVRAWHPGLPIFWGGYHISMVPGDLPASATAAVLGEGEVTFVELLRKLDGKATLSPEDLAGIKGIAFRRNGELVITGRRDLVGTLDDLPMPDWGMFRDHECMPSLISSRGCLFRCSFCSSSAFWGHGLRRHSAERVVEEMVRLHEHHPNAPLLLFHDDTFTESVGRLERIADIIEERGISLPAIWGHGRAALINERMLRVLKRLKVISLSFGFESGSNRVLKRIKAGSASMGINFRAALDCHQNGINGQTHIIVGNPGETVQDAVQSLNLIYMSPLGFVAINTAMPLPGTEYQETRTGLESPKDAEYYAKTLGVDEYMNPRLIDRMTLEEFRQMRRKMDEVTAGQELTTGRKRHHALVGIPWGGGYKECASRLTSLYSTDFSMGLHVVLFGVPESEARALYLKFPVVIPTLGHETGDAESWLASHTTDGIPWIFLPDSDWDEARVTESFRDRLQGSTKCLDNWADWRVQLEEYNARLRKPDTGGGLTLH